MQKPLFAAVIAALATSTAVFAQETSSRPDAAMSAARSALTKEAIERANYVEWQTRKSGASEEQTATSTPSPEGETPNAADEIDGAATSDQPSVEGDTTELPDPFLIRLQVLLDRAHASPGVIDGLDGGNTAKAIKAYEEMQELDVDGVPDAALWDVLAVDQSAAMKEYEITQEDLDARYVPDMPEDYAELAKLEWLGYRDPVEMLAERFHMDEDLLRALNPDADFQKLGQKLVVADIGGEPETKVAKIVIDKERGELFAYDAQDELVMALPATIGSSSTPSPEGTMKVNGSAQEPTYEYDPDTNFQQGDNSEELTLPAGPNGPVGNVWIDLSKPTYGIHGTPEPSEIDKTASHGCVRLTNWDAQALSKLVLPAETVVEFR